MSAVVRARVVEALWVLGYAVGLVAGLLLLTHNSVGSFFWFWGLGFGLVDAYCTLAGLSRLVRPL